MRSSMLHGTSKSLSTGLWDQGQRGSPLGEFLQGCPGGNLSWPLAWSQATKAGLGCSTRKKSASFQLPGSRFQVDTTCTCRNGTSNRHTVFISMQNREQNQFDVNRK